MEDDDDGDKCTSICMYSSYCNTTLMRTRRMRMRTVEEKSKGEDGVASDRDASYERRKLEVPRTTESVKAMRTDERTRPATKKEKKGKIMAHSNKKSQE